MLSGCRVYAFVYVYVYMYVYVFVCVWLCVCVCVSYVGKRRREAAAVEALTVQDSSSARRHSVSELASRSKIQRAARRNRGV